MILRHSGHMPCIQNCGHAVACYLPDEYQKRVFKEVGQCI